MAYIKARQNSSGFVPHLPAKLRSQDPFHMKVNLFHHTDISLSTPCVNSFGTNIVTQLLGMHHRTFSALSEHTNMYDSPCIWALMKKARAPACKLKQPSCVVIYRGAEDSLTSRVVASRKFEGCTYGIRSKPL